LQAADLTINASGEAEQAWGENCSKKVQKSIDSFPPVCNSERTHGNTNYKYMRTKALLCAAVLAVGAIAAVAQSNVYSLNIVGYVNVNVPGGYSLLANPLSAGVTNGANEIMTPLDGEQILTWNGAGYDYVSFSSIFGGWIDINLNPANPPSLPPGKGFFFFNSGAATTVTFVGQVVPSPGVTNTTTIPSGYSLVGSALPASVTDITAAPVSLPVLDGEQVLQWNGAGYNYASYSTIFGGWIDINLNPISAPPYSVGSGFFLFNSGAPASWSQSLP
jgi:hypothetical protein